MVGNAELDMEQEYKSEDKKTLCTEQKEQAILLLICSVKKVCQSLGLSSSLCNAPLADICPIIIVKITNDLMGSENKTAGFSSSFRNDSTVYANPIHQMNYLSHSKGVVGSYWNF